MFPLPLGLKSQSDGGNGEPEGIQKNRFRAGIKATRGAMAAAPRACRGHGRPLPVLLLLLLCLLTKVKERVKKLA